MTFWVLCVSKDCSAARRARPSPISGLGGRQLKKQRRSPLGSLFSKGKIVYQASAKCSIQAKRTSLASSCIRGFLMKEERRKVHLEQGRICFSCTTPNAVRALTGNCSNRQGLFYKKQNQARLDREEKEGVRR